MLIRSYLMEHQLADVSLAEVIFFYFKEKYCTIILCLFIAFNLIQTIMSEVFRLDFFSVLYEILLY
jgi:hypothetical protein